ncbi:MAG: hypothetical protein GY724_04840 [Actinomycetia bacterium]|nr:hypothetical protein [Actinomycetes bacterium]MCP4225039.1 hypothetical protein [Actinomycetes bacterium]MCP5034780.1 hypothetical protein [Actinomycetes bacterium]
MKKFWLMDQHGADGPTALVETNGRLRVVDVLRFGPSITELDDQQEIWDKVIGKVAPTLKPFVNASAVDEEGVAPLPDLQRADHGDAGSTNRAGRRTAGRGKGGAGQVEGAMTRRGSRGER